jgi:hypothetical protein
MVKTPAPVKVERGVGMAEVVKGYVFGNSGGQYPPFSLPWFIVGETADPGRTIFTSQYKK